LPLPLCFALCRSRHAHKLVYCRASEPLRRLHVAKSYYQYRRRLPNVLTLDLWQNVSGIAAAIPFDGAERNRYSPGRRVVFSPATDCCRGRSDGEGTETVANHDRSRTEKSSAVESPSGHDLRRRRPIADSAGEVSVFVPRRFAKAFQPMFSFLPSLTRNER
jgi:hypothetical protein